MKTRDETIQWHDASKELPDSEETVLIHCPGTDEPVWLGFHDGDGWNSADASSIDGVKHWAHMPEGPQG